MNRLSPLINRPSIFASAPYWEHEGAAEPASQFADDLKLFVTAWLGGLVFFGTLLA